MDTLGNYRCLSGCNNNHNRSVCCFTCLCCFSAVSYRCTSSLSLFSNWSFSARAKLQILTGAQLRAAPPFHGANQAEIPHFDITHRACLEQRVNYKTSFSRFGYKHLPNAYTMVQYILQHIKCLFCCCIW